MEIPIQFQITSIVRPESFMPLLLRMSRKMDQKVSRLLSKKFENLLNEMFNGEGFMPCSYFVILFNILKNRVELSFYCNG